ncbi:hypothetical protein BB559_000502 [Furculomyces boomerangus]|uniref:non-specific serine/threonine protein kinase n=2 Tax=Harpellales TaxID=61421 RepID=A0A2T9Z522_9FUNG|nr:hypothetical protein BB559_000502 [Furculomyces boomerangus]PVZ97497.1 hypothetical protein BB558_006543 [Smittium angustum]PVZ99619.1 hypothetical protein BB558_004329 [Smittium angustum]
MPNFNYPSMQVSPATTLCETYTSERALNKALRSVKNIFKKSAQTPSKKSSTQQRSKNSRTQKKELVFENLFNSSIKRQSTITVSGTQQKNILDISERSADYISTTYGRPIKSLGSGSDGAVSLYVHQDGGMYAIKTFFATYKSKTNRNISNIETTLESRVVHEIKMSNILRHKYVSSIIESIVLPDGSVHIVMDYYKNDLFTVVQEHQSNHSINSELYLNKLFYQLLVAIEYIHNQANVAHRDIKLDNICVDFEGNLKLIDFGCASVFDPNMPTNTTGLAGSDPYIAPEVFEPNSIYDPSKVDIWAIGIVYLAMVSGRFPWEIAKSAERNYSIFLKDRSKIVDHWLPKLPSGSPSLEYNNVNAANELILAMLDINPDYRPTISQIKTSDFYKQLYSQFGEDF